MSIDEPIETDVAQSEIDALAKVLCEYSETGAACTDWGLRAGNEINPPWYSYRDVAQYSIQALTRK